MGVKDVVVKEMYTLGMIDALKVCVLHVHLKDTHRKMRLWMRNYIVILFADSSAYEGFGQTYGLIFLFKLNEYNKSSGSVWANITQKLDFQNHVQKC